MLGNTRHTASHRIRGMIRKSGQVVPGSQEHNQRRPSFGPRGAEVKRASPAYGFGLIVVRDDRNARGQRSKE